MNQTNIVEKLKEILKNEYGINNKEEFEKAVQSFSGINLGLFTTEIHEGRME